MRSGKNGSKYIRCSRFGEAILEYGWPNFKYEVLEDGLTKEEAEVREQYWIEKENSIYPFGYNLEAGGKEGHSVNDDTKKKMSESRKGQEPWNTKKVCQYTKEGQLVSEFPSLHEASRQTGISIGSISKCCKGQRNSAGKYIWAFSN